MKKLLGVIGVSLLILALLAGCIYLKENNPKAYQQLIGGITDLFQKQNDTTQQSESSTTAPEAVTRETSTAQEPQSETVAIQDTVSSNELFDIKDSSASEPITDSTKETITEADLKSMQRANMVPLEGVGKAIGDTASLTTPSGRLGEEYTFSELMYPYRAMLNDEEKKAYNQVYANALDYNSSPFAIQANLSTAEMDDVMAAVYNDHPELFWMETQYSYLYKRNGTVYSVTLIYNDTVHDIANQTALFTDTVNKIVAQANTYATEVEKEKYVHDYLAANVTYDEGSAMNQTAYSALINGRSVCAGYSRAFQHILMQLNIPTYFCTGIASGGPHAWNIIKLGEDFYNVDTLWDDSVKEKYNTDCYLYFNKTDADFNNEHQRTDLSVNLPACNGTAMAYETVFGGNATGDMLSAYGLSDSDVLQSIDEYYAYCVSALTQAGVGQSSFTVALVNKELFDQIYQDINQQGYVDGYMKTVAQNLGLADCSMSLHFSVNELPDGHVVLTQDTSLVAN